MVPFRSLWNLSCSSSSSRSEKHDFAGLRRLRQKREARYHRLMLVGFGCAFVLKIATVCEKVPCLVPLFRRTLLKDFEQELEHPTNASRVWCCNQ